MTEQEALDALITGDRDAALVWARAQDSFEDPEFWGRILSHAKEDDDTRFGQYEAAFRIPSAVVAANGGKIR
jgi:hypothetical protein